MNLFEVVADIAPCILTRVLGGSLQQQGQDGDGDVGVNAMRRPVEHRAHLQSALHRPPGFFHALLLFVAQRHVFGRQGVVVAMDPKFLSRLFLHSHTCRAKLKNRFMKLFVLIQYVELT